VGKLARLVLSAGWKRATRDLNFGHLVGEGVLQPSTGRYMVDYGSWAVLYGDGDFFGGRSGRRLETLDPWHAFHQDEVLWLLRLMCGTTEARVEGHETLRETSCAKFAARVDLARASSLHDGGLRAPAVEHFEELLALPWRACSGCERASAAARRSATGVRFADSPASRASQIRTLTATTGGDGWHSVPRVPV
jgi:hypothetical protein